MSNVQVQNQSEVERVSGINSRIAKPGSASGPNPPLEERVTNKFSNNRLLQSMKFQKITKGIVGILVILILLKVTTDPNMLPEIHVKCLVDNIFSWTSAANDFFQNNRFIKRVLIATLALLMDLALLTQLYIWCIFGKTWRYPMAVTMLYMIRLLLGVSVTFL